MSKLSLQNLKPKRIVETDPVQKCIGSFGKFQYMLAAATFLCKVPIAMHQLAHVFLAPKVDYTCGTANKTNVCPCETPEFNKSVFTDTMAMKWKLICKEKWQVSFTQTLFMFGVLIGSIIFGGAADSYGRRRPFLLAITLQFLMSLTLSFAESYTLFLILRGIVGLTVGATMSISFIILMEFIGTEYRELLASLYQLPFNLGHLLLPLIAYFFRDFRKYLLGVSLPGILLFCSYCLIPETPRWLISAKKTDKAVSVMTRVAKM